MAKMALNGESINGGSINGEKRSNISSGVWQQ